MEVGRAAATLAILLTVCVQAAHAQKPAAETRGAGVDVSAYGLEGRLLLNVQDFSQAVAPFVGPRKTAADIELARSAVEQVYRDLGYCRIGVTVPAPGPQEGVVRFRLVALPAGSVKDCRPRGAELQSRSQPAVILSAAVAPVAAAAAAAASEPAAPAAIVAQTPAAAPVPPGAAPATGIPALRFDISRFEVIGNTLLPASELERVFTPYTGPDKDFDDIQRALEALEQAYRDSGYGVVQVRLPEQDITQGIVQFRALQPRVNKVLIEGNMYFDDENIRRSLPTVKEDEVPNSKEIARNLQLVGEHPLKQTSVLLRPGASEDQVDVNIKVTDDKPWRSFLTLDNTGTSSTGYARLGLGWQHTNLFDRDQTLTAQYVTSPTDPDSVKIYGAGYRIPFYGLDSVLDLVAGYSDVDSGKVQGLFSVSGAGTVALARWNYIPQKWQDIEQKVTFGLDYRAYKNQVQLEGSESIVPDITVHPVSLGYSGLWRGGASELSFYGSFSRNIPGGHNGTEEDWRALAGSRQAVVDDYEIYRYGFNLVTQFRNEWQTRLGFNGQYTGDALVSGEQYGIGGPDTVRGYPLRELAKDKGYAAQLEFYTPDVARGVGLSDSYRVRFLAFYDYGWVENNDTQPTDKANLASAGVGLRVGYGKTLSLRLDVAQLLRETATLDNGSKRFSAAMAVVF